MISMRHTLVIVNYMRTNPTIVDDLVFSFKDKFKKIYVVNRNTNSNYKNIEGIQNVEILEVNKGKRFFYHLFSLITFLNKDTLSDIGYAIKKNFFSIKKLFLQFKYYSISNMLFYTMKQIQEIKTNSSDVTLLSVWFTSEALAISKLKKKYKELKCISMAHAHEIETEKNDDTFFYKKVHHKYLDNIIFISKTKLNSYLKYVCNPRNLDYSRCKVLYWGSKSDYIHGNISNVSDYNVIVSCSTVEPLKRVEQIAKAISLLPNNCIWHHFGDGRTFDLLEKTIETFSPETKKRIFIHGRVDNSAIKTFYRDNKVDLFINFSTTEGLPISVMEALSYGIPCIVTDVGGEREIIDDGLNGFVLNRDSTYYELAELVNKFISLPPSERIRFKEGARNTWERKFDLSSNIDNYYEVLK